MGNVELHVKLQQVEVGLGHATDQLQHNGTSIFLPRPKIAPRRLIGPANSSPDIDLPGQIPLQVIVERVWEAGKRKLLLRPKSGALAVTFICGSEVGLRDKQSDLKFFDRPLRHA